MGKLLFTTPRYNFGFCALGWQQCSSPDVVVRQVAGEREVKAQIKLRFRNVNGKPIVCTRSLQLTQQANDKKVCKTLESALQTYNAAGEVEQLPDRFISQTLTASRWCTSLTSGRVHTTSESKPELPLRGPGS